MVIPFSGIVLWKPSGAMLTSLLPSVGTSGCRPCEEISYASFDSTVDLPLGRRRIVECLQD
jgi:hypothetical protein